MESWTGVRLKSTACYGVRLYFRGSVLATHVDRVDTHVVSAIINVAQVHSLDFAYAISFTLWGLPYHLIATFAEPGRGHLWSVVQNFRYALCIRRINHRHRRAMEVFLSEIVSLLLGLDVGRC